MTVSAIVAKAQNGVIGKGNKIPWHLPDDLKFFKKTTLHHHVLMGRKVFDSMGKALPGRINLVVSRNPGFYAPRCLVFSSIDEAIHLAGENGESELFIIGGAEIYEQSKERWDKLYLTLVKSDVEGDVRFPEIDMNDWNIIQQQDHARDDRHEYAFSISEYERI